MPLPLPPSSARSRRLRLFSAASGLLLAAVVLVLAVAGVATPAQAAAYEAHQKVPVLVNTVGPFHNPAESYRYYSLPYCSPKDSSRSAQDNLGEVLAGDRRSPSLYDIRFGVDIQWTALCQFTLSQDDIRRFTNAIKQHYLFELFVDELPVKGFVGELEEETLQFEKHTHTETHVYLSTHWDFSISYNGNHVIAVNLTTDPQQRVELEYGKDITVEFSYSARWTPVTTRYADRLVVHSRSSIGEQQLEIHWLSIINSFVLVLLLTAFLGLVLVRALHKDFARYMDMETSPDPEHGEDGEHEADSDESGWKLVAGDVFRQPKQVMLFASAVGNGAQILALVLSLLCLALVGTFYPGNRGALYSACVLFYALTACIAGYVSTGLYLQLGGSRWATQAVLTTGLFALPLFVTFSVANSVAWAYGSSSALPAQTIVLIMLLWALVSFPLTIFGSMRARAAHQGGNANAKGAGALGAGVMDAPCKTNRVEREIPSTVWYRSPALHLLVAGFLPFSAIYMELHYIFASVWGHRPYTLYGILALAFLMLLLVTGMISVALCYFNLCAEDYRWWWRSLLSGAATGGYMYAYAMYYYHYRSEMSGALQATFFFGYMACVSYAFALMLGFVAFVCARKFVYHIYQSIKID